MTTARRRGATGMRTLGRSSFQDPAQSWQRLPAADRLLVRFRPSLPGARPALPLANVGIDSLPIADVLRRFSSSELYPACLQPPLSAQKVLMAHRIQSYLLCHVFGLSLADHRSLIRLIGHKGNVVHSRTQ